MDNFVNRQIPQLQIAANSVEQPNQDSLTSRLSRYATAKFSSVLPDHPPPISRTANLTDIVPSRREIGCALSQAISSGFIGFSAGLITSSLVEHHSITVPTGVIGAVGALVGSALSYVAINTIVDAPPIDVASRAQEAFKNRRKEENIRARASTDEICEKLENSFKEIEKIMGRYAAADIPDNLREAADKYRIAINATNRLHPEKNLPDTIKNNTIEITSLTEDAKGLIQYLGISGINLAIFENVESYAKESRDLIIKAINTHKNGISIEDKREASVLMRNRYMVLYPKHVGCNLLTGFMAGSSSVMVAANSETAKKIGAAIQFISNIMTAFWPITLPHEFKSIDQREDLVAVVPHN
jgi:hypothetical protein